MKSRAEKQDNPPRFGKMGWVFLDMKDGGKTEDGLIQKIDELLLRVDSEFAIDAFRMPAHRVFRNVETASNSRNGVPMPHQIGDLALASRKRVGKIKRRKALFKGSRRLIGWRHGGGAI